MKKAKLLELRLIHRFYSSSLFGGCPPFRKPPPTRTFSPNLDHPARVYVPRCFLVRFGDENVGEGGRGVTALTPKTMVQTRLFRHLWQKDNTGTSTRFPPGIGSISRVLHPIHSPFAIPAGRTYSRQNNKKMTELEG